jgi:hypothetical protein
MRPLAVLSAFLDVSSLNLAARIGRHFFAFGSSGDASGPPWPPEEMRLSRFNQAVRLDDPGVRLRLIAEIRNYSRVPTRLRHLNADPPILLPYQPVCRFFPHGPSVGYLFEARRTRLGVLLPTVVTPAVDARPLWHRDKISLWCNRGALTGLPKKHGAPRLPDRARLKRGLVCQRGMAIYRVPEWVD